MSQPLAKLLHHPTQLCVLGCAVFLLLVAAKFNDFQVGAYQDDAHYLTLAHGIAEKRQFTYVNLPSSDQKTPLFPIGFPLLLAPIQAIASNAFWPLKLVCVFATAVNGFLLFRWWPVWTRTTPLWGLLIALAYWFSPLVTEHARLVMSEAPFFTYYLLVLALLHKDKQQKGRWWFLILLPLLCVALVLTRTIGIAFVAGIGGYYLFSWRIRRLSSNVKVGLFAAGSAILLLLLVSGRLVPQRYFNSKYIDYFSSVGVGVVSAETSPTPIDTTILSEFAQNRWENVYEGLALTTVPLAASVAARLDSGSAPLVQSVLGVAALTLTLVGAVAWVRRVGWDAVWITFAAYIGLLLVWHWSGNRLLYAVIPHLLFALLLGSDVVFLRWFRPKTADSLRLIGATLFLSSLIISSLLRHPSLGHVGDVSERMAWLKANVPANALVMSQYPETDYLYSAMPTLGWPADKSTEAIAAYVDQHAVDYVLVAPAIEWDDDGYDPNWDPFIWSRRDSIIELADSAKFEQVYRNELKNIEVYKVNRTP